jgi:hypothetical protein
MLHATRYYSYLDALLIMARGHSDAPPRAELISPGVLDDDGERLGSAIRWQRDRMDAN